MTGTAEGWIDLSGQLAVVTGAAGGIGGACADEIAAAGATVVLLDREGSNLAPVENRIRASGGTAVSRALDVTDKSQWDALGEWIAGEWGHFDILVNAAGIARFDRVDDAIFDTYHEVFAVNVEGSLNGMTTALKYMREAGKGAIVNISSCASLKGNPTMASYGASKAAISHFTRSAALEVTRAGHDIRINAVLPGFTDTAMALQVYDQFDDKLGGREKTLAVFSSGRPARPEEMANLVLFLASDRASFISGSTYVIDRAQSA